MAPSESYDDRITPASCITSSLHDDDDGADHNDRDEDDGDDHEDRGDIDGDYHDVDDGDDVCLWLCLKYLLQSISIRTSSRKLSSNIIIFILMINIIIITSLRASTAPVGFCAVAFPSW